MLHRSSLVLVEEGCDDGRPDRYGVGRAHEKMSIAAMRRKRMEFGFAAGRDKGRVHALSELRTEISVVLDIHPQHRYAGEAAEFAGSLHELVGCAIVVRLVVDAAAAAGGEG